MLNFYSSHPTSPEHVDFTAVTKENLASISVVDGDFSEIELIGRYTGSTLFASMHMQNPQHIGRALDIAANLSNRTDGLLEPAAKLIFLKAVVEGVIGELEMSSVK